MKNTFKKAHEMAREIKAEYPEVDYQAQFGICLSYLLNNKEAEDVIELKGTVKQVKWAEDIRAKMEKDFEYYLTIDIVKYYNTFFSIVKDKTKEDIKRTYEIIMSIDSAKWFIDNDAKNIVEIIVECDNKKAIEKEIEKIDLTIFKGAIEYDDLDYAAMDYMDTLTDDEADMFLKQYEKLTRNVKMEILRRVK